MKTQPTLSECMREREREREGGREGGRETLIKSQPCPPFNRNKFNSFVFPLLREMLESCLFACIPQTNKKIKI